VPKHKRSTKSHSNVFRLTIHFENTHRDPDFRTTEVHYNVRSRADADTIIGGQQHPVSKAFWNNQQIV
jgi:hypothetical protein